MSVFNADTQATPPEDVLEALVGEGKKFKTIEDLARAKWESDRHIERLTSETGELREDLNKRLTFEELLERLQKPSANTPTPERPVVEAHQPAPAKLTDDDLSAKVEELLSRKEQQNTVRQNVDAVANKLIEVYGSEDAANQHVKNRARELGVSVEFLQDVAAKSPTAFYATVGVEAPQTPGGPTKGNVNTAAFNANHSGGPKANTYAWYQDLRRNSPRVYHDPKTQIQMHKHAQELGAAFYN